MARHFPDFLEGYIRWSAHHEAATRLHMWSILSVMAASVERKVFMNRGYYELYPNLYVFVVGASGIVKKSTSTGMAVSLLRELEDVQIMSDRVTAGSLIEQIAKAKKKEIDERDGSEHEQTSMFIYASELIVFIKEVFGSVLELLTTFWDNPKIWKYQTKHHGHNELKNVCLNMLGATTIQWLREGITSQVMSAGFAGRVVFVCQREAPKKWVAWPTPPKGHERMREKLIEDLREIHALRGEMKVTDDAREAFRVWYEHHMEEITKVNEDQRLNGYLARKGEMILKVAMLRSISLSSDLILEADHVSWAESQLSALEPDLIEVYSPAKIHTEIETKFKILDFIRVQPSQECSVRDIRFKFSEKFTVFQINAGIDALLGEERIIPHYRKMHPHQAQQSYRLNKSIQQVWKDPT